MPPVAHSLSMQQPVSDRVGEIDGVEYGGCMQLGKYLTPTMANRSVQGLYESVR